MKIALNNKTVTLSRCDIGTANCYECCFLHNWSLCGILELRDHTICRTVKVLSSHKLNDIFIL